MADGRRAVELDPKNARAHLKYASILYDRNYKDPLAVEHAEAAVRLDPNNWQNHRILSEIYSLNGDHDRAVQSAKRAVELSANENTYGQLATAYFHSGDLEQALIAADEGIRLTRSPDCYYWRERIREKRGDYAGAIADYDRVIAQLHFASDVRAWARADRANLYTKLGRYEEAIEDWNILATNPLAAIGGVPVSRIRAIAHLHLGHQEEAVRDFERADATSRRASPRA